MFHPSLQRHHNLALELGDLSTAEFRSCRRRNTFDHSRIVLE